MLLKITTKPNITEDDFFKEVIKSGKKRGKKKKKHKMEAKRDYNDKLNDNKSEMENLSIKCDKLMKLVIKCEKYFKDKLFSKEHKERPCIVSGSCETKWKYGSTLFRHMVEHHRIPEEEANISISDYFNG